MREVNEQFLKDVANHQMTVLLDQSAHRHLRFAIPGSSVYHFNLVTWPGYLAVSGDMGSWVFSRLVDMFEFFRRPDLRINEGYWAEKCQAACTRGHGVKEFSKELFRAAVCSDVRSFCRHHSLTRAQRRELISDVRTSVLHALDDGEHFACVAVHEFSWNRKTPFVDFWDHSLHEYTYTFQWILYAIVWGIQQYDAAQSKAA